MRLAFTSDIHTDVNGPETLEALVARARELSPEVLLVAGDIATAPTTWLQTVLALKAVVPRLLLVAGNHDVWTTPELAGRGLDSWGRLEKLLPALAEEAGAELLDQGPVVIGQVGFVGSLGWYDYSTREAELQVPMETYRSGVFGGLRWMDQQRAIWLEGERRMEAEEVAERLRKKMEAQLGACGAERLVVATHTLAFPEQIHRRDHPGWRFINAFMGSYALGQTILGDSRVKLAIAGHTHLGSDLQFGGLRAMVSPLGYRREWQGMEAAEAVKRSMKLIEI